LKDHPSYLCGTNSFKPFFLFGLVRLLYSSMVSKFYRCIRYTSFNLLVLVLSPITFFFSLERLLCFCTILWFFSIFWELVIVVWWGNSSMISLKFEYHGNHSLTPGIKLELSLDKILLNKGCSLQSCWNLCAFENCED